MTRTLLIVAACASLWGCTWQKVYVYNCRDVCLEMPASTSATIPVTSTANVPVSGGAAQTGDTATNVTK